MVQIGKAAAGVVLDKINPKWALVGVLIGAAGFNSLMAAGNTLTWFNVTWFLSRAVYVSCPTNPIVSPLKAFEHSWLGKLGRSKNIHVCEPCSWDLPTPFQHIRWTCYPGVVCQAQQRASVWRMPTGHHAACHGVETTADWNLCQ